MVQLPEKVENSKFQNLCELGEYRISKTGQEIITQKDNLNKELDVGFKVYELRNSTLRQWDENPETFEKQMELFSISPFIDTSTNGEIADEIALKTGIPLDVSPMVENEIYHYYNFEKELFIVLGDYDETLLEVLEDNRVLQFATIVIMELEEGSEIKFNLIEKLKQDENLQNHFNVEWI
ncbi:hypothetical protein [Staphylococcus saprophyticus]|uniref:hypothetical protein n=1 Tax=Staphylococcus saprophyticus TaxID=29385 RepID=UPI000E0767B3|nr:hypothetical protein [Staphylococcus saprophyticus]SUN23083.1 Uncharacterised protein [Staphylococcus saprophyticus]